MNQFTKKDYAAGMVPAHYIFYTDTYIEGITSEAGENGIVQIRGVVDGNFNIVRAAESLCAEIRTKYFDKIMQCNNDLQNLEEYACKRFHTWGGASPMELRRAKYYLHRKREIYTWAFNSITVEICERDKTIDISVHDPVTPYESHFRPELKTCESTIMFLVTPVHKLDNRLNNKSEEIDGFIDKLARTWL